jgi:cobalt-precorrin-5B (C1)-methyltransferase
MTETSAPARGTRTGFTTGACSAAAARAATLGLLQGAVPTQVECLLPNGQTHCFAVTEGRCDATQAHAVVIKDAGDDPDCTDKAPLTADVALLPGQPGQVLLEGGEGVGTVTMPGLGLEVGKAAINPVPRRNIEANVRAVAAELLRTAGLRVTISVPGGQTMAKKTTNARLGILGGISILGTTGIVKPYSTAAYRASVVQGVHVAGTLPQRTVVLTTGGRTEAFVMREFPDLPEAAFVQMGDFLRYALGAVVKAGIRHVVIGGMVGKLSKIAQGETITHAGRADVNTGLLADLAAELGAPLVVCDDIRAAKTARYAGDRMTALGLGLAFHTALAQRVVQVLRQRYEDAFTLRVLVCDFDGNKITEASS